MFETFCPVVRIAALTAIPDADEIEHARVFDLQVIVQKGRYAVGDVAIYLPPDAVLPPTLADSLRGQAKLFGERRNRVRPYRLRGAVSEGILLGPLPCAEIGSDAATILGVTKYQTPIPTPWRGRAIHVPGLTIDYDIRSAKRYPNVLREGETVEVTEKVHGTMCAIGWFPGLHHNGLPDGDTLVYSKGLGATGHALAATEENNLYLRVARQTDFRDRLKAAFNGRPATIVGEIHGVGIQDLDYGKPSPDFALFDIYLGVPGRGHWLDRREVHHIANEIAPEVPVLYEGPLHAGVLRHFGSGPTIAGSRAHMREGIVARPVRERFAPDGRSIVKFVSPEYLSRPHGTEHS